MTLAKYNHGSMWHRVNADGCHGTARCVQAQRPQTPSCFPWHLPHHGRDLVKDAHTPYDVGSPVSPLVPARSEPQDGASGPAAVTAALLCGYEAAVDLCSKIRHSEKLLQCIPTILSPYPMECHRAPRRHPHWLWCICFHWGKLLDITGSVFTVMQLIHSRMCPLHPSRELFIWFLANAHLRSKTGWVIVGWDWVGGGLWPSEYGRVGRTALRGVQLTTPGWVWNPGGIFDGGLTLKSQAWAAV